jgi:tRNA (guanine-N7-)-methyltransferase
MLTTNPWSVVFGNTHPVYVEVGPGRGEFLLRTATEHPEHNFFAIERSRARIRELDAALGKRPHLANVRIVRGDAPCVLAMLPDASVAGYYVLFPDPWWKLRHRRRRVLTPEFIATLRRTLVPGGSIRLATDVAEYFVVAQEWLNADGGLERVESGQTLAPSTSFSRKAQRRGVPTYISVHRRCVLRRNSAADSHSGPDSHSVIPAKAGIQSL